MIILHRLGHQAEQMHLNPDLIITIEANPDTVIALTTGAKIVVAESAEQVALAARHYRIEILAGAMARRNEQREERSGTVAPLVRLRPAHDRASAD
jgi:flagellar protein FlbD